MTFHYGDPQRFDAADAGDEDGAATSAARPSKSEQKRRSSELQTLGQALSELPDQRLQTIEMPAALRDAIAEFRRTKSHEGRRRQLQYVGKLMRSADEAALREAVAAATIGSADDTLALHRAERWRAELIADDDALTRWLTAHPETDSQQMRSLVRQARRDAVGLAAEARQPKSFRELFQLIRPKMT